MFRKLGFFTFLFIAVVSCGFAQAPVLSTPTATPAKGCAPLAVSFNVNASGPGTITYAWNFGGVPPNVTPATSSVPNASALFNKPGIYTVTITATNANGSTSKTVSVEVYPVPSADFSVDKSTGCFPTTINFTNTTVTGPGETITGIIWDFGDGFLNSTDQNPSHRYTAAGSFPVTLAVANNFGCTGKAQVKNVAGAITLSNGIFPDFSTNINSSCTLPVSASFTNQTNDIPVMSWKWDFGDGGTDNSFSPNHNYAAPGNYNVKLIAISSQGCVDTLIQAVQISASGSLSDFANAGNICINTPATFKNISAPAPNSSLWDYGDGSPIDSRRDGQHTYTTPGVKHITLTNNFGGCTGTVTKDITVVGPPMAAFTGSPLSSCTFPFTTTFQDQTAGATSWLWNFGDATTSTAQNPSHAYTSYGIFMVTLTANSALGAACANTVSKTAFVNVVKPLVSIPNAPAFGCAPFTFTPSISVTAADGVASYHWDLGNGVTFDGITPPAQTYAAGTYNILVTITTNTGCQVTGAGVVQVGNSQPTTAFTATPTFQCVGQPINFKDQSTGGANKWLWDFGDGSTETQPNPVYSYTKPGTYDVTLTAYNNGCLQKLTKTAFITINPPLADFTFASNCASKNLYTFTNTSIGATTWDWDFGDGSGHSFVSAPPAHLYPAGSASYNVSLKVTNGGCSNTITKQVVVNQSISFNVSANPVCPNTLITLSATAGPGTIGYLFDFGDGTTPQGSGGGATSHSYAAPGDFPITVMVTDNNGCTETSAPYTMHVSGPTVQFTTPTLVSCGALAAVFQDQSTPSQPTSTLTAWEWDYGDGTTGTDFNHNYTLEGIFSVKLKVTDVNGCSDSLTKTNYITVSNPQAKFSTDDTLYCPSSFIKFTNLSKGGFTPVYTWDFKDATTFTGPNPPLHNFTAVGYYPVSLTIKDMYNCTNTFTMVQPIRIDTPNAKFTMSAAYSACPPLNEQFTFAGHYALTYTWTFDNNGTAVIPSPSSIYSTPGDYYPKLIVKSPGGCIASFTDHIHIDGPVGSFTYSPFTACDSLDVNFSVVSSNSIVYIWNYNDGHLDTTTIGSVTHHYNVPGGYTPFVTLQDAGGCKITNFGNDLILIDAINRTSFTADKNLLCDNGTVQFTSTTDVALGTVINNYQWNFGDGSPVLSGAEANPNHLFSAPGVYNVTLNITTVGGCAGTFSLPVTVVASPSVKINGIVSQCEPAVLTFSGVEQVPDPNGPLTWSWNFGNTQTATGQNPPPVSYPKAGEYIVQLIATNSKGCTDTSDTSPAQHLFIYPSPTVNAGPDTTICLGSLLQLNAVGSTTDFKWLPPVKGTLSCLNCVNPVANTTESTYFVVDGTSLQGCGAKDTVLVTVNVPVTVNVSGPDSVCIGQSAPLNATGAAIYTWTPAQGLTNPAISNPVATPDASQLGTNLSTVIHYSVTGYDNKKCFSDTKNIDVTVFGYPQINMGPNATINVGTTYPLTPSTSSNVVTYLWSPANTLSCSDCPAPIASPTKSTKYSLTTTNDGGCSTTDTISIQVVCTGANFFVPNSFSPNGDGKNDQFIVNGVGLNVIPSITIYNRWGQIVFQKSNFAANSAADAWDGTFNGQPAPADVYIYTMQILCNNATLIPYHGNVTLIR